MGACAGHCSHLHPGMGHKHWKIWRCSPWQLGKSFCDCSHCQKSLRQLLIIVNAQMSTKHLGLVLFSLYNEWRSYSFLDVPLRCSTVLECTAETLSVADARGNILLQDCSCTGSCSNSRRLACSGHNLPGFGYSQDGKAKCHCSQPSFCWNPRLHHCHLLWQDRNPHDKSDVGGKDCPVGLLDDKPTGFQGHRYAFLIMLQ